MRNVTRSFSGNHPTAIQNAGRARSFSLQQMGQGGPLSEWQRRSVPSGPTRGVEPPRQLNMIELEMRDFDFNPSDPFVITPQPSRREQMLTDPLRPWFSVPQDAVRAAVQSAQRTAISVQRFANDIHTRVQGGSAEGPSQPKQQHAIGDDWMDWEDWRRIMDIWGEGSPSHPDPTPPGDFNPNDIARQHWIAYGWGAGAGGVHEGRLTGQLQTDFHVGLAFALGSWRHHRHVTRTHTDALFTHTGGGGSYYGYQVMHGQSLDGTERRYAVLYGHQNGDWLPWSTSLTPWPPPFFVSGGDFPHSEWTPGGSGYQLYRLNPADGPNQIVDLPERMLLDEVGYCLGVGTYSNRTGSLGLTRFHGGPNADPNIIF